MAGWNSLTWPESEWLDTEAGWGFTPVVHWEINVHRLNQPSPRTSLACYINAACVVVFFAGRLLCSERFSCRCSPNSTPATLTTSFWNHADRNHHLDDGITPDAKGWTHTSQKHLLLLSDGCSFCCRFFPTPTLVRYLWWSWACHCLSVSWSRLSIKPLRTRVSVCFLIRIRAEPTSGSLIDSIKGSTVTVNIPLLRAVHLVIFKWDASLQSYPGCLKALLQSNRIHHHNESIRPCLGKGNASSWFIWKPKYASGWSEEHQVIPATILTSIEFADQRNGRFYFGLQGAFWKSLWHKQSRPF